MGGVGVNRSVCFLKTDFSDFFLRKIINQIDQS